MSVLARYLSREFFKLILFCLVFFVVIYVLIDFLQKVDNFMDANASAGAMLTFLAYKTPYIVVQMTPAAALIAAIVLFCRMKSANEITALKACGLSIARISVPILISSAVLAGSLFLFSELIVPYTSSKSHAIYQKEVRKRYKTRFYGRTDIWYKGANAIYWIRHYNDKEKTMENPTFYFFDDAFGLEKKIRAERAVWSGRGWRAEEGTVQSLQSNGRYHTKQFEKMYLKMPETPEAFVRTHRNPEEMSYWELRRFAERTQEEGYDETRYRVDMNIKIAFPLIVVAVVLISIPISLGLKFGGAPLAVSIGTCVCFLYLITIGLSRSLGLSGILPPFLSAWLANMVFFLIGIYLMIHLET